MPEILDYSYPVMYSPASPDTLSIILTDMDEKSPDAHMRFWKIDFDIETDTFRCTVAQEKDDKWRIYESYESVNKRLEELSPVPVEECDAAEYDRETVNENMKQMFDTFRIWYERYAEEEEMNDNQREVYAYCCKRDHIDKNMNKVGVSVGGVYVRVDKVKDGYRLKAEDTPSETVPAEDMIDAIMFLPEYMAVPEVIEAESIRMRSLDGRQKQR